MSAFMSCDRHDNKGQNMQEECFYRETRQDELEDYAEKARDYMLSHGHLLRTKGNPSSQDLVSYAPFNLFPSPVPKNCFDAACAVQEDFNILMHRIAHDYDFLKSCIEKTIEVDDFTRHLWEIFEYVQAEGSVQELSLGMNRSDYMLHQDPDGTRKIKQVEFNTMASSMAGLSQVAGDLHRYLLKTNKMGSHTDQLPINHGLSGLAEAMVMAWEQYGQPKAVVLYFVENPKDNIHVYDKRLLDYAIHSRNPQVNIIRKTVTDMHRATLQGEDRRLLIDGFEVAVVYQRWGYSPHHFNSEEDWKTILVMERSRAILCPSVGYHLAGCKKVQQVLAVPGVVEKFLDDADACARIRETFGNLYSFEQTKEGDAAIEMALAHPERYVVKPQREGGGNNTYGDDIPKLLTEIRHSNEREAYILMERILPPAVRNCPVRVGSDIKMTTMISELGIYGTFVGSKENVLLNKYCGFVLRTKELGTDEGGVASGFSVIDSPLLV